MKKKKLLSPSEKRMIPSDIWKRRSSLVIMFIVDLGSSRNRKWVVKGIFIISKLLSFIIWVFIFAFIELLSLLRTSIVLMFGFLYISLLSSKNFESSSPRVFYLWYKRKIIIKIIPIYIHFCLFFIIILLFSFI